MTAPRVFPFRESRDEERYYLPRHILAAVKRETAVAGVSDWANYAQAKLDRELRTCSLLLTDEQVAMLHQYAEVLGSQPQDLLAVLLAPEAARRERRRRQVIAYLHGHRPKHGLGCLTRAVLCGALLIGMYLATQLVLALGAAVAHP